MNIANLIRIFTVKNSRVPMRVAVPVTLALSFPVGLGLGETVTEARATTCDDESEAWSLELAEIEEEGMPDASLRDFDWPAEATISAYARSPQEGWFHDGPETVLNLRTPEAP